MTFINVFLLRTWISLIQKFLNQNFQGSSEPGLIIKGYWQKKSWKMLSRVIWLNHKKGTIQKWSQHIPKWCQLGICGTKSLEDPGQNLLKVVNLKMFFTLAEIDYLVRDINSPISKSTIFFIEIFIYSFIVFSALKSSNLF